MATVNYYEQLNADDQNEIDQTVASVIDQFSDENPDTHEKTVNLPKLLAMLERLNAEKKSAKEAAETKAKEEKEANKASAELAGVELAKGVEVGDFITFKMNSKEWTLPVLKKNEKTFTVELPAEALPEGSKSARRFPKFASVTKVTKASAKVSAVA